MATLKRPTFGHTDSLKRESGGLLDVCVNKSRAASSNDRAKFVAYVCQQRARRGDLELCLLVERHPTAIEPTLHGLPVNANCAADCRLGLEVLK